MQKVLTLTATCLLGILLCASAALADEVKTDHFTLNLPSGWTQPQPVQSAQGATMAILQNAAEQTVITVAVTPVPLSAKDLAIQTIANMKAAGFTTSEPGFRRFLCGRILQRAGQGRQLFQCQRQARQRHHHHGRFPRCR